MPLRSGALLLALVLPAVAGEGFVGSEACKPCHAEIWARQALSAHAGSLFVAAEHPLAGAVTRLGNVERAPGFVARFYRAADALRVRVLGGGESTDMAIDWAFGAGGQGLTFVSHLDRDYYLEHGLSLFGGDRLLRTPGHAERPRTLGEAVGVRYRAEGADGVRGCFECHSTGPVGFDAEAGARISEAGVRCEACHGPGAEHLADPAKIQSGKLTPGALSAKCGACHRQPGAVARVDWSDPWNVRHAPVYLARSACYEDGAGKLSCTTCHDPHGPLAKSGSGHYRAVCAQCHPGAHGGAAQGGAAQGGAVPGGVAQDAAAQGAGEPFADCVSCHMPAVRPHESLRFTNHWIGAYGEGKPLQPARR